MRLFEIKNSEPSGYVYHASMLPMSATGLRKVMQHGLIPSKTGYSGPGIYFSQDPAGCYAHVSPEDSILFRVKWDDLLRLYGRYRENKTGIQWDDEEIIVPGRVPANLLEVEFFPGEWWDLESAYAASRGR